MECIYMTNNTEIEKLKIEIQYIEERLLFYEEANEIKARCILYLTKELAHFKKEKKPMAPEDALIILKGKIE